MISNIIKLDDDNYNQMAKQDFNDIIIDALLISNLIDNNPANQLLNQIKQQYQQVLQQKTGFITQNNYYY